VVAIVPGFSAHSGYYAWAAAQLAARGLAAYAVDLRGCGHSDGQRFYVKAFADYVSDVASLVVLGHFTSGRQSSKLCGDRLFSFGKLMLIPNYCFCGNCHLVPCRASLAAAEPVT